MDSMRRLAFVATLAILAVSCVVSEFTSDVSQRAQGKSVVGHCFALRRDAYVIKVPERVPFDYPHSGAIDVYGYLAVEPKAEHDPRQALKLPAGSHISVERVLSHYQPAVGHIPVTPYIRIPGQFNGQLVDASEVFERTWGKNPLLPAQEDLESCQ